MKNKLIALCLAACCLLAASSCGSAAGTPDATATAIPAAAVSVCPTASASPEPTAKEPVLTEIDPYVIKADVKAYLSEQEQETFRTVLDAVFAQQSSVKLPGDYDSNLRVLGALLNSPYYFFVSRQSFTDDHTTIELWYEYSLSEQTQMREFMESEYLRIINSVCSADMNDTEKTMAIYRYFSENISYDYEWVDGLNMSDEKYAYPEIEIYRALKTGSGVCHTYTYLCEFALQQLGVECLRIACQMSDDPEVGHMWLIVRLDGKYYHCDPTWESTSGYPGGLEYFGMTDAERIAGGISLSYLTIDGAYGEISCDSETFAPLRGVYGFEFGSGHTLLLHTFSDSEPVVFSTLAPVSAG